MINAERLTKLLGGRTVVSDVSNWASAIRRRSRMPARALHAR
jgi:hypothetical protein